MRVVDAGDRLGREFEGLVIGVVQLGTGLGSSISMFAEPGKKTVSFS